jgi:hypothetical protein
MAKSPRITCFTRGSFVVKLRVCIGEVSTPGPFEAQQSRVDLPGMSVIKAINVSLRVSSSDTESAVRGLDGVDWRRRLCRDAVLDF